MKKIAGFAVFILCSILCTCVSTFAQDAQESFGKSRVQFKNFRWQYLSSNNFEIYYYGDNKELATQAVWHAEAEFNRITEMIGFAPYVRTKLYIYASKADMLQSNVGLDAENNIIIGGKTSFAKSIVEVPFPGDHISFREEISIGIAKILIYDMLYGGSLKEVLQSTYLLILPDWFIEGAAFYVAKGWNNDMDNTMRDMMLNQKVKKPSSLIGQNSITAGQSIWNFIAIRYGKSNIANILNLTRIIRNEESSISNTLGVRYLLFVKEWREFYLSAAEKINNETENPTIQQRIDKLKKTQEAYQICLNPSAKLLAYTAHEDGISKVYVLNTATQKHKVIYKKGYQLLSQKADEKLPALAWQSDDILLIVDNKKGNTYINAVNVNNKKTQKRTLPFDQVRSLNVSYDKKTAIFSAVKNGKNDLFSYTISSGRVQAITNDLYDDIYPTFLSDNSIVFSSNRPNDSLPAKETTAEKLKDNLSLFRWKDNQLKQITNTPFQHIKVSGFDEEHILFLNNENGIFNLTKYNLNTQTTQHLTNYRQDIKSYDYQKGQIAVILRNDLRENIYTLPLPEPISVSSLPTTLRNDLLSDWIWQKSGIEKPLPASVPTTDADDTLKKENNFDPNEIDIRNYVFENEKNKKQEKTKIITQALSTKIWQPTAMPKLIINGEFPYQNKLTTSNVVTNPIVIDPLRGWSMTMQVGLTDIFEDHKIKAGALINMINLRSNDYYLEYEYLKKRIDYGAKFLRKSIYFESEIALIQRYNLSQFEAFAAYPLSVSSRIKVSPIFAITRMLDMTQPATPNSADISRNYIGGKTEYIFDNTTAFGLNMYRGTRAKVGVRYMHESNEEARSFGSVNVDIRHYQKVHRSIILAMRLSYGSFFGNSPKPFLLGGMNNWIFRQTQEHDTEDNPLNFTPTNSNGDQKTDWLFMEYVTNMRGFRYNTLYGTSYLLFNAELRIPIVQYLYNGPISSSFFRNLQFTAFTDIGSAWTGESPFNQNNSFNTRILRDEQAGFNVTVINYQNPFLTGYGFGVRTMVFNYYVKSDLAWGIKDYENQKPILYLTLGYDF